MPRKEAYLPPSLDLPTSASLSPSTSASTSPASPASPASTSSSLGTRRSIQSSVDSGYAPSLGSQQSSYLPPHPDYMLSRTYENWKIADAATQRLFVDLRSLEQCEGQLRKARKRQDTNRCVYFQSPPPFSAGHDSGLYAGLFGFLLFVVAARPQAGRKPSLLQLRFRRKTLDTPDPVSPPPSSSFQLDDDLPSVEHLEKQLETLNNRVRLVATIARFVLPWLWPPRMSLTAARIIDRCDAISLGEVRCML